MDTLRDASAETIKVIRKKLKLTQSEFAELFNNSEPTVLKTAQKDICRYEKGTNGCPLNKFMKFQSLTKKRKVR